MLQTASTRGLLALISFLLIVFSGAERGFLGPSLQGWPSYMICFPPLFVLLLFLFKNTVLTLLFLPAIVLAKISDKSLVTARMEALKTTPGWKPILVPTPVGAVLDGVIWSHPKAPRRWLLWCNANGICYEDMMSYLMLNFGVPLECNLLLFNYRGVGRSSGPWPTTAQDLIVDTSAAFEYLIKDLGAKPNEILIYGHSIGAAVGAIVRRKYPEGPFVSDRSFTSFSTVAKYHSGEVEGIVVGVALGLLLAFAAYVLKVLHPDPIPMLGYPIRDFYLAAMCAQLVLISGKGWDKFRVIRAVLLVGGFLAFECSAHHVAQLSQTYPPSRSNFGALGFWRRLFIPVQYLIMGVVFGGIFYFSRALQTLTVHMIRAIGWEMDQEACLGDIKGHKLVLYHSDDSIVPPETQLATVVSAQTARFPDVQIIQLTKRLVGVRGDPNYYGQYYHNYCVPMDDPRQWNVILPQLTALFGASGPSTA